MPTPTPKIEASPKPAPAAETKANPAPAGSAGSTRDAQIASVFDSCIPGGAFTQSQSPAR